MDTPKCGGKKPIFPRAVGHALLDLRALRLEIEEAQALARDPAIPRGERQRWLDYSDRLEGALDVRIDLLDRTTQSHDKAIAAHPGPLCRAYCGLDATKRALLDMASQPAPVPVVAG